jgi:hypothetical protein
MAQVLGAPFEGEPELQNGIIELLRELNEQVRADSSCGLNAMVLRAFFGTVTSPISSTYSSVKLLRK